MAAPAIDFNKLSIEERLQMLDQLWDSLSQDADSIPLSDEHRAELDRRLDDLDQNPHASIPWDEVMHQIRNRGR